MAAQNIVITAGGTVNILPSSYFNVYYVSGSATLGSSFAVAMPDAPAQSLHIVFIYTANITLGSNHITFLNTQMPDIYAAKKVVIDCYYDGSVWFVFFSPSLDGTNLINTANIIDTDVTLAKLENVTSGKLIIGNSSNRPTAVYPSQDVTMDSAGAFTLGESVVHDSNVADVAIGKVVADAGDYVIVSHSGGIISSDVPTAKLDVLVGLTPGTVAASKAIVVDDSKAIDALNIVALSLNGTLLASTGTEINALNGATAGTASANKVLVLGASKNVDVLNVASLLLAGTAITSSAAELNALRGITAVVADLNLLAGQVAGGLSATDLTTIRGINAVMSVDANGVKFSKAVRQAVRAISSNDSILVTDNTITLSLSGSRLDLTLPLLAAMPSGRFTFIVKSNGSTQDIKFIASGSDGISYGGSEASSKTIAGPTTNSVILVVNDGSSWTIGY